MFCKLDVRRKSIVTLALSYRKIIVIRSKIFCKSAPWTLAQKGLGSNCSRDGVG